MTSRAAREDAELNAWEAERPDGFLRDVVGCMSRYDYDYRSMAAEVLALRAERRALLDSTRQQAEEIERLKVQMESLSLTTLRLDQAEAEVRQLHQENERLREELFQKREVEQAILNQGRGLDD